MPADKSAYKISIKIIFKTSGLKSCKKPSNWRRHTFSPLLVFPPPGADIRLLAQICRAVNERWRICAHQNCYKKTTKPLHFKSFYMAQIRQRTKAMLHICASSGEIISLVPHTIEKLLLKRILWRSGS